MKREYNRPTIEKIAFDYRNQVVAASGTTTPMEGESREAFIRRLLSGGFEWTDIQRILETISSWFN